MNEETLQQIFQVFRNQFPPAKVDDFSLKLTSADLFQTFARFYPAEFSQELLFEKMIAEGYIYSPENKLGTIKFHWLLKEGKSNLG